MIHTSERSKKALRKWLKIEENQDLYCPWYGWLGVPENRYHCRHECAKTFPKTARAIKNKDWVPTGQKCPSGGDCCYSAATVRRRFKKLLGGAK